MSIGSFRFRAFDKLLTIPSNSKVPHVIEKVIHMRRIVFVLAALIASGTAFAQTWKEYSYPDDSFTVSFPAEPKVETTTYQAADGSTPAAHVYGVEQGNSVFKMTVVDFSAGSLAENAIIDHAIKAVSQSGEIKVDIPHRVSQVYGRQLSILGADRSRSLVALFYHNKRLYQLEATSLPKGKDATADNIRFQQSLTFTGGGSNRTGEQRDRRRPDPATGAPRG